MDPTLLREERSVRSLLAEIDRHLGRIGREIKIMEVCGTHTMTAYRSGLGRVLRGKGLRIISGPGCPVCITPDGIVGAAADLVAEIPGVVLASFGDMLRVPTNRGALLHAVPGAGSSVRTVYSPEEVLALASADPGRQVVFLAVGFETTIPSIAWTALEAGRRGLTNLSFISSLRLVPPPLREILSSGTVSIDGFIYPGHVSVIIGTRPFEFIAGEFGVPGAVAGFEPADLLLGVLSVLGQIERGEPGVENTYRRAVRREGNPAAQRLMESACEVVDGEWRGFGVIPGSGMRLRDRSLDAAARFFLRLDSAWENAGCQCGEVVKGNIEPEECPLFRTACSPEKPMGPCMVSVEGSCLIHYKYGDVEWIG